MFNLIDTEERGAKIKVIGVGGAGRNAILNMLQKNILGAEFICANTDVQAMLYDHERVSNVQLGCELTRGLGAGAKPEVGRQAALENKDQIIEAICGADMIFIAAGMGGGTGTGAAPVIAELAKQHDILTVAVVTTPFKHENKSRSANADQGLEELIKYSDSLMTIDNNKLLELQGGEVCAIHAFDQADMVLTNATQSIIELVTRPGYINVDFADLRTVMAEAGRAVMGTGEASGANRVDDAVALALNNPLINQVDMSCAKGLLINVTASREIKTSEYVEICEQIQKFAIPEATVVSGLLFDDDMGDYLRVSVIAAGLEYQRERRPGALGNHSITTSRVTPAIHGTHNASVVDRSTRNKTEYDEEQVNVPAFLRNQAD